MSYSLNCQCAGCKKKDKCLDSTFIQGAIYGIHSANYANGVQRQAHMGCGNIQINCQNFDDEKKTETNSEILEETVAILKEKNADPQTIECVEKTAEFVKSVENQCPNKI